MQTWNLAKSIGIIVENTSMNDVKRDSPSFHRNIMPITEKLHGVLPSHCEHVLEIGSGSGQHAAHFSHEFPKLIIQPTEYEADSLASISSWCDGCSNVQPATQLDVTNKNWFPTKTQKFDALFCFNVIHITPREVTQAIFKHGTQYMNNPCQIIFYGPFKVDGQHTSDSNAQFENWLKDKDSSYGIRDIEDVESVANLNGFKLDKSHTMPANNFLNVYIRA